MLRPYRELFAAPGAWMFSLAGFVARMPMATMSLGIVLLVVGVTDSYGVAGALAGTFAFVGAATAPLSVTVGDASLLGPVNEFRTGVAV